MLLYLAFILLFYTRIVLHHSRRFTDYAQKVHITPSEFHFALEDGMRFAVLTGTIRNDTRVSWNQPSIEVQYFDKQGRLIDTETYDDPRMTLAPYTEQEFKIQCEAVRPNADYTTHKVVIRYAEEANRFNLL